MSHIVVTFRLNVYPASKWQRAIPVRSEVVLNQIPLVLPWTEVSGHSGIKYDLIKDEYFVNIEDETPFERLKLADTQDQIEKIVKEVNEKWKSRGFTR